MDVTESTPGRKKHYVENPQNRRENGTSENLNKGYTHDGKESPLWDQVGELDGAQITKDIG